MHSKDCRILALAMLVAFGCAGCDDGNSSGQDSTTTDTGDDSVSDVTADTPGDSASDPDGEQEPVSCTQDADCDDGLYCNGEEICGSDGTCRDGTPVDCNDDDPCTQDDCDEGDGRCVNEPLDGDGDGFVAMVSPGGYDCGGDDCDDTAVDIYPDAADDECDLIDKDCDDSTDEHIDDDQDGWIDARCDEYMTDAGDYEGLGDCADDEGDEEGVDPATIHPGAPEGCDGTIDHDCDGDATDVDSDADLDGYSDVSCEGGTDCNDADADIHPGATEVCDLVDDNCDGSILDAEGIDDDGDGVPDEACGGSDCDDTQESIHGAFAGHEPSYAPSESWDEAVAEAVELCDTIDQDCDTLILDEDDADDDSDDYLDEDCGGDDCNDLNVYVHPGAPEDACDSIDNDCDGDEIDGIADDDDDDYLDADCTSGDDCDDTDPDIYPGAPTTCDLVDDDCSGSWQDESGADDDGDGVLDEECGGSDCDDLDSTIHGGQGPLAEAPEVCDLIDQDCDGTWTDAMDADDDGDGYLDEDCTGGDDCDDTNASVHPGATEICDLIDQDCDGSWADGGADDDGDGVLDFTCAGGMDCDDESASTYPGAPKLCDGLDHDCDTVPDRDSDGDGQWSAACGGPDCDDDDDTIYAGADEICADGIDQDCDGSADGLRWPPASITRVTNATGYSNDTNLVWTGSEYAVVWSDSRGIGTDQLYLRRLAPDGTLRGSEVQVTSDGLDNRMPILAWSGSEYGLAWIKYDSGTSDSVLFFRRISADGTPVGIETTPTMTFSQVYPHSLTWTGSEYVSAHVDANTGEHYTGVYVARFSATGSEVGSRVALHDAADTAENIGIAWTGSELGVVYSTYGTSVTELYLARLSPTASRVAADVELTSWENGKIDLELQWTGSLFGIVFGLSGINPDPDPFFMSCTPTGGIVASETELSTSTQRDWRPSLAWTGSEFVVMWERDDGDNDLVFQRITADGTLVEGNVYAVTDTYDDLYPSLAWSGSEIGFAWSTFRYAGTSETAFQRLTYCE